jgi:hypothetical protein
MDYSINPNDIKSEIEKLGHKVENMEYQAISDQATTLHVFVDIFGVEFLQQCQIKFEPPKQKREITQCSNFQRYGHKKITATYEFVVSNGPVIT